CNVAQHFAAHAGGARLAIGHHAAGRGNDGHAQAVHDLRDGRTALVDTQDGARDAFDALDDRTAGVVLEGDLEDRLGRVADDLETIDVAFVLQHGSNGYLQLGGGHADRRLVDLLRVAHAGQHVGDGIAHAQEDFSYHLDVVMPGTPPPNAL